MTQAPLPPSVKMSPQKNTCLLLATFYVLLSPLLQFSVHFGVVHLSLFLSVNMSQQTASPSVLVPLSSMSLHPRAPPRPVPYVLRLRVANLDDEDFIEIDYDENKLNYRDLIETCCEELGVDKIDIEKIRKLPDVTIRRDEDVQRFNKLEHLEVVIVPARMQKIYNYQI